MRTDLDHLPAAKRADLERVLQVLFAEFAEATKLTQSPVRKAGRILKVVLFGSHARGDWVADERSGYRSDYDLLVVVNQDELTDLSDYWVRADEVLARLYLVEGVLSAPVNFIVHSLADINRQLRQGRYFFCDIVSEGISLYDSQGAAFEPPHPLDEETAHAEAQSYFDEWFTAARTAFRTFQLQRGEGSDLRWRKDAAFSLHQTCERLYVCVLLVLTLYSPKSHKLNFLRSLAEALDPRLIEAWPRDDKGSRRAFELLRRAYVEARYSAHYKITEDELDWLSQQVETLQRLVEQICRERLAATAADAAE